MPLGASEEEVEARILPWEEVLQRLAIGRPDRRRVLAANLPRPDLVPWLLARLEAGDIPREQDHRPWVHLLRGVLDGWEERTVDPVMSRREFIRRVLNAGARHQGSQDIVYSSWEQQRFLDPSYEAIVEEARFPLPRAGVVSGMYLVVLEDLLRSHLEQGSQAPVLVRMEDPIQEVRSLALRLLLQAGAVRETDWLAAAFEGLSEGERRAVADWIGAELEPERAAALLLDLQGRFRASDTFFGAWQALALRAVGQVETALLADLAAAPRSSTDEARSLSGESPGNSSPVVALVGRTSLDHSYMVAALSIAHHQGGAAADPETFLAVLDQAWNPLVRVRAWTALAGGRDAATRRIALDCLQQDRGGFLRDAGRFAGYEIGESLVSLARRLQGQDLRRYLDQVLPGLELKASVRAAVLQAGLRPGR
ncbi:MAG: hypothetical protein H8E31_12420 [Planctomycetes bacterium]|nr:hypothetical protein [Planctomycetota bacterium]